MSVTGARWWTVVGFLHMFAVLMCLEMYSKGTVLGTELQVHIADEFKKMTVSSIDYELLR